MDKSLTRHQQGHVTGESHSPLQKPVPILPARPRPATSSLTVTGNPDVDLILGECPILTRLRRRSDAELHLPHIYHHQLFPRPKFDLPDRATRLGTNPRRSSRVWNAVVEVSCTLSRSASGLTAEKGLDALEQFSRCR